MIRHGARKQALLKTLQNWSVVQSLEGAPVLSF